MHTRSEHAIREQESDIPISVITLIDESQNSSSPNTRIGLGREGQALKSLAFPNDSQEV